MKLFKNSWEKFVLWATIIAAILGAIRDRAVSFSLAGLFGCIIMGIIYGSIAYGIWKLIRQNKKREQAK